MDVGGRADALKLSKGQVLRTPLLAEAMLSPSLESRLSSLGASPGVAPCQVMLVFLETCPWHPPSPQAYNGVRPQRSWILLWGNEPAHPQAWLTCASRPGGAVFRVLQGRLSARLGTGGELAGRELICALGLNVPSRAPGTGSAHVSR